MSIPLYFKIVLINSDDKYKFEVTEMQADYFALYKEKYVIELNTIYSIPNEKTWIYVKHEESVEECCVSIKEKLEFDEENRRKKNLLLFKAKNKLINYENSILNERIDKLNNLQYELKQKYDTIK